MYPVSVISLSLNNYSTGILEHARRANQQFMVGWSSANCQAVFLTFSKCECYNKCYLNLSGQHTLS